MACATTAASPILRNRRCGAERDLSGWAAGLWVSRDFAALIRLRTRRGYAVSLGSAGETMPDNPQPRSDVAASPLDEADNKSVRLVRDLFDLAAAIKWIEGELTASATPAADGPAAVERLQDIAMALRERAVDAALCDALEAAAHEMADVVARGEAGAERALRASKLLPVLANRIGAMIAAAAADGGGEAFADPPGAPAIPRPAASDLLTALRLLSEEELIALFS
jgi:hypothetical protein